MQSRKDLTPCLVVVLLVLVYKNGDVTKHLDVRSAKVNYPIQRINLDIPKEMLQKADMEAARIGVTRTSLFKIWIAEHLDHLKPA